MPSLKDHRGKGQSHLLSSKNIIDNKISLQHSSLFCLKEWHQFDRNFISESYLTQTSAWIRWCSSQDKWSGSGCDKLKFSSQIQLVDQSYARQKGHLWCFADNWLNPIRFACAFFVAAKSGAICNIGKIHKKTRSETGLENSKLESEKSTSQASSHWPTSARLYG
jgi:hypothetical protein